MQRGHGAAVAGVHGLEHVERFGAPRLADDDAVRPHAKRVDHQLALRYGALPFDGRFAGLEPHDVPLLEHQLRNVLDGDDSLCFGNEARESIKQCGLACTAAAGDHHVQPRPDAALEQFEHRRGQRGIGEQLVIGEHVSAKTANR